MGQGDAALVEWPSGEIWLIDAGPPSRALLRYLRRRGIEKLENVFLSHPHLDHMGGLIPLIGELPVDYFWTPRPPKETERAYRKLWEKLRQERTTIQYPQSFVSHGARLLHPLQGSTRSIWEARTRRG